MQGTEFADRRALRGTKPAEVRQALDAVCREMGIRSSELERRAAVARSIEAAWQEKNEHIARLERRLEQLERQHPPVRRRFARR